MGKKIFAVLSVLTLSLCVFACVDTKTGLGGLGEITITGPASSGAASGSEGENPRR